MSGLYIPGMELPPNVEWCEIIIRIQPDGTVLNAEKIHLGIKAIELPPHGDLIDRSKIVYTQDDSGFRTMAYARRAQLENVTPVIPADGGESE